MSKEFRPWGYFEVLYADEHTWLKRLVVDAGQRLSAQRHRFRKEYWQPLSKGGRGEFDGHTIDLHPDVVYYVPINMSHRLINPSDSPLVVIEWAVGRPDENDIERLHDDYGR